MMASVNNIPEDIMAVLKEYAKRDDQYINPNFLSDVATLLEQYYQLEDDDVDKWIQDTYSR